MSGSLEHIADSRKKRTSRQSVMSCVQALVDRVIALDCVRLTGEYRLEAVADRPWQRRLPVAIEDMMYAETRGSLS